MAYGEKYYHEYCDTYGNVCRISILEDEYAGATSEVEAQENPILITYDSDSDFKFDPVRSSSCEVFLTFGTGNGIDFEEFWTADERKFKVEHYIDSEIDWVGYVIPNGFGYELKGGVYYASIQASDGLSTLSSLNFLDDTTGDPYGTQDLTFNNGFEFPFVLIATEILRKLDLDLNLWTCVNLYERTMTKTGDTRDADPLATSYVNVKTYINQNDKEDVPYWRDQGEVLNCREVLENLLLMFGAKIYQSKGTWRIKTIDSDVSYGTGSTQLYWRKYNTLCAYLGREIINDDVTIPCATINKALIGTDHIMRMDEVYRAYRMNYDYTFVREGDNPVNLLENGDFSDFDNNDRLAAPRGWYRYREGNKWHPRLQGVTISDPDEVGGYTTAIEMGTQKSGIPNQYTDSNAAIWAALRYGLPLDLIKGDQVYFSLWQRLRHRSPAGSEDNIQYLPAHKMTLTTPVDENGRGGKRYYLRNKNFFLYQTLEQAEANTEEPITELEWVPEEGIGSVYRFFWVRSQKYITVDQSREYRWEKVKMQVPPLPDNGRIEYGIHGLSATNGRISDNYPSFNFTPAFGTISEFPTVRKDWIDEGGDIPRYQITGIELGIIPDESESPEGQDFIYNNPNNKYSLETPPAVVLNGDVQDSRHISNIIVPTNVSEGKNFWDTLDEKYGGSSLGLTTVRTIMNQYFLPNRILEGTIKSPLIEFGTRFEFEAVPNIKFIIQRGSFNRKKGYFQDAMFVQISEEELPTGGTEGGNTVDPSWVSTGLSRCVKDGSNLNTGGVEIQEVDANSNSETFEDIRWVYLEDNLTMCPIGEPNSYYWGADAASYDVANFESDNYYIDTDFPNEVQVSMTNSGGLYLYFLHLSSLGVVNGVETVTQPEIISVWQYLSDTIIDGFTYRVLRMNYVTADYEDVNVIFKFV